jgi:hypothetical protein
MASKEKKAAFAALDEANKEYKQVCTDLKKKYGELDTASDNAIVLISNVEALIESIRRRPWSYKAIKHKITVIKKKFLESRDLKRQERNKNIVASVVAGGVFAGGLSLFLFMKEICKKDIIKWIICLAFFVFVLAGFLVYKLINSIKTAKKAYEQTKIIQEETHKNRSLYSKADAQKKKIELETAAVHKYFDDLTNCAGCDYKALPEETKEALGILYNLTLALTELVNAQIG